MSKVDNNALIAYLIQCGCIDISSGKIDVSKIGSGYTIENRRVIPNESNTNSARDAREHDEGAE